VKAPDGDGDRLRGEQQSHEYREAGDEEQADAWIESILFKPSEIVESESDPSDRERQPGSKQAADDHADELAKPVQERILGPVPAHEIEHDGRNGE
jgi:hypothetical protein